MYYKTGHNNSLKVEYIYHNNSVLLMSSIILMACNTITYKHTKYSSCGKDDELYGFFTQKVFNTPKRKIFTSKKTGNQAPIT